MSGRRVIVRMFVGFILLQVAAGCSHLCTEKAGTEPYVKELGPEDYPIETKRLLDVVDNHPEENDRNNAHLHLAKVYTNSDNPEQDYKKAADHFEKYIASEPETNVQSEVRDWLVVLKKLERQSQKIDECNAVILALRKEKNEISNIVNQLKQGNHDLNDKIEKLKALEIRYERKKRHYR